MDRSNIRVKAFAVFQRKSGEVLMHDVKEKDGTLIGYRIPGGHVEFGERADQTILREIQEEISQPVKNVSFVGMLENTFVYQDVPGHEVIFLYKAEFEEDSLYGLDIVPGFEPDLGVKFDLLWIDPNNPPIGVKIFPTGLTELLSK